MKKTNYVIGVPCSPAKPMGATIQNVTRILMSFGGGMGGSTKTYYATKVIGINDREIVIKTFNGQDLTINPRFIVESEVMNLVKVVTDTLPWKNYNNTTFKKHITTEYILIGPNDTYSISTNLTHRHDAKFKVIETEVESEEI